MGTRIRRKTYTMRSVTSGTDKNIGGCPIPEEGILHGVRGEIHFVSATILSADVATQYGLSGWLIGGFDPDTKDSYDDLWDRYVPKDEDLSQSPGVDQIDLDTTTPVTAPAIEFGEPRVEALVGLMPAGRFYKREKLVSFANSKGGWDKVAEDYKPTDILDPFDVNIGMRTDDWSVGMLSVSNPSLDEVSASVEDTPDGTAEWTAIKYVDTVVEDAWKMLVGLTETGAEAMFESLAAMLRKMTEPTVREEVSGTFTSTAWRVFARLIWDYEVPGDFTKPIISSG